MYRVSHLTSVHTPFDTRIFHREVKSLAEAGYGVTLIARHAQHEVVDGVELVPLPSPRNRFLRMLLLIPRVLILALRQRATLYHLHDPELLPVGLLLKLLTRARVVYDAHEDYPKAIMSKFWLPLGIRRPVAWLFDRFERFAVHFVDGVVVAADSIAYRFPAEKSAIIHNFPMLVAGEPSDPGDRHEGRHLTLVYAGVLAEVRGVVEMIQSLERVDQRYDVRLKLLGRFTDQQFAQRAASLDRLGRVEFCGWLSYDRVLAELELADIGLCVLHPIPNYIDSMPNKLFEYMSVGLPVVASNFPNWVKIVEGHDCGLTVDPFDLDEIARAVESLAADPGRRQEMGQNGRRAVAEKYNWQVEANRLDAFYRGLLQP